MENNTKPFVKWVGGKRSILSLLVERLPVKYSNYYESFVGGGALYFAVQPQKAFISDINSYLINTYSVIKNNISGLIECLKIHEKNHNKNYYLKIRKLFSKEENLIKQASYFIYLNKTCFNGLYRVNKSGNFNVPIGDYKSPLILDEETLRADHFSLQSAEIFNRSFLETPIKKNGFYYFDPPYHKTYSQYDKNGFGDVEHKQLSEFCNEIDSKGGYFMVSNSDTDFIKDLYKKYNIENIMALRSVSCSSEQRGRKNEFIIRNY
jgi:DNA adenine methylase